VTEPNDKIMNRIRALLTKAESTEFTGEADALTAKAYDLMATHGIEQALLGARLPNSDKPGDRRIRIPAPYAGVKSLLFNGLSQALRCRAVRIEKGRTDILHVFGFQSDLERLDVLYTSLLLQAGHAVGGLQQ